MTVQHVALEVSSEDVAACEAFWRILGFERVSLPPTLKDRAVWVQRHATQIHLLLTDAAVVPPQGHVAVVAPDPPGYDATFQALAAAGFTPEPRTQHWGAERCFVRDPAGHRVEVMAAAPE